MDRNAIEILSIIEEGTYQGQDIRPHLQSMIAGMRVYDTPPVFYTTAQATLALAPPPPTIRVVDAYTDEALQDLASRGLKPCGLNFASHRTPGGGFLRGAKAQEEDLCRQSTLYASLIRDEAKPLYVSQAQTGQRPALYSPDVVFVKNAQGWLPEPFTAGMITMAAPNQSAMTHAQQAHLRSTFEERWKMVLGIAANHGHRNLVLGAWGCGIFGNDPCLVAETFLTAAAGFDGFFDEIVFAIPDANSMNHLLMKGVLNS